MTEPIQQQLAGARESLLDLSLRNKLLNFRPTRRTTIRIVDELPAQIWRLLVAERKQMAFLALEEHERYGRAAEAPAPSCEDEPEGDTAEAGEPALLFDLPAPESAFEQEQAELAERYTDQLLQTALAGGDLQVNLLRTYRAATSALDERGVNLLFLAVGFLHWRQEEQPDRVLRAPIVMIPVLLRRTSANRRFQLLALDDEPVINPCLPRKLADEHIEMPPAPASWDEFDVDAYLEAAARAIVGRNGWSVEPAEMVLALFSFSKYLMYVDLDASRWPAERPLLANPLLRVLCGDGELDAVELPEARRLDALQPPEQTFQVLDADSSQRGAILAAKQGASLVIEGPPGTGKSQTIANVIAECLAVGRTVLFVSQKMAALEVVQRRLAGAGLGEFCLELHSTKANRRAALEELRRTMRRPQRRTRDPETDAARLDALRRKLDEHVHGLHTPLEPEGPTPYEAMGRAALLRGVPDVECDLPGAPTWDAERVEAIKQLLQRLVRTLQETGAPAEHAWRGAKLTRCSPRTIRQVEAILARAGSALAGAVRHCETVAALLDGSAAEDLHGMRNRLAAARRMIDPPAMDTQVLASGAWTEAAPQTDALVEQVAAYAEKREWLGERVIVDLAETIDWRPVRGRMLRRGSSLFRWLIPSYWGDRRQIKAVHKDGRMPRPAEVLRELQTLIESRALRDGLLGGDAICLRCFGATFGGEQTDWPRLAAVAEWLNAFGRHARRDEIGPAAHALAEPGADRTELIAAANALEAALADWDAARAELKVTVELTEADALPDTAESTALTELGVRVRRMAETVESLFDWAHYQEVLGEVRASPLAAFVDAAAGADLEPELMPVAMEKRRLALLLEHIFEQRPRLRAFSGRSHEADIDAFIDLDREWIERAARRLGDRLAAKRPTGAIAGAPSSQLGILQGEIRRKRGGRPIRRLLADAADLIQTLKPCLMMSPLSVAQFIAPAGMRFDVVIFDEASQVEPADALGAVARGEQLLLVGDPKQLPPTNFFTVLGGQDAAATDGAASLADLESILDRGAMVLPTVRLRWHYRSRHESLIEFSNREFYDGELVVFPASHAAGADLGVSMVFEPGDRYDRGRSQTNRDQARRIAAWVFEHARVHSDLSLGVGAFSQAQQQAILDEIERLRREDDSLESFFARDRAEPFFVKNLETIQGDERDVIGLSVGYGRPAPGERFSLNLGPLTREGGWRRLNVLITRARRRCVVFSSVLGEDFDLSGTQAVGVKALKGYLDFARTRELPDPARRGGSSDSPLEQAVFNALAEQGVKLHRQVGCPGHEVALAVLDDAHPGRYVLGIECDGEVYRGAATTRDRERGRPGVLEGLGWRVHRIWAVDWYRKPDTELERALDAIRLARAGRLHPRVLKTRRRGGAGKAKVPPRPKPPAEQPPPADSDLPVTRYQIFTRPARKPEQFYTDPSGDLCKAVIEIVSCEGPVHADQLTRRMAGLWGLTRAGTRIAARVAAAVERCIVGHRVRRDGEFLVPYEMAEPPIRRRDDDAVRDIDLICPEEITRAACLLLTAQFGMSRDDLIIQTARLFGFQSTGAKLRTRIGETIDTAIAAGAVVEENGVLKTAASS